MKLQTALGALPERFRWTLHNLVAHPLSEVLFQVGLVGLSDRIHDGTIPSRTPTRGADEGPK